MSEPDAVRTLPQAAACAAPHAGLADGMCWRAMNENDVPAVAGLEQALSETPWTAQNFIDSLAGGHAAWVVLEQQACIGYAVTSQVLDEMELLIIGVAAHRQRQGLGQCILQRLMQHGRGQGARCLHLEVRESNRAARALYARCGFQETGRRRNYYVCAPHPGSAISVPGAQPSREDALLMTVDL